MKHAEKICDLCFNTDKREVPATMKLIYERTIPDPENFIIHQKKELVKLSVCNACFELVTDALDDDGIGWSELPIDETEKVLLT